MPPPRAADDILEETLKLFRAQVFFKNYETKGGADLTLTYMVLFTQQCIQVPLPPCDVAAGSLGSKGAELISESVAKYSRCDPARACAGVLTRPTRACALLDTRSSSRA